MLLSQAQLIIGTTSPLLKAAQASQVSTSTFVINIDGDLKANVSKEVRDILWRGNQPRQPDRFAGDPGQSQIKLGYNFTDPDRPTGECEIRFVNAYGNRPFAFASSLNGALMPLYLNQTRNLVVHFDINLESFRSNRGGWLRIGVVVALQNEDGKRLYFEQDIQDNSWAMVAMPVVRSDVFEAVYTSIPRGKWVHLEVPFDDFMHKHSRFSSSKSFFDSPNTTFLESVYLVNECFGSGYIKYSIANWWITVEPFK